MKRRDFVIGAAAVVGTLPVVRTALGQTPCPPGNLNAVGGTSGKEAACGEGATSSLVQVRKTPEQIAVYADASSFDASAYATLEYKLTSASTWRQGHPLYRVRPGTADDAFAGCIFDLQPGRAYDVRVTFTDGSGSFQEQAQFSTRRLPADVSQQSATTTVSSLSEFQTAINNANPGDVIELSDGTYSMSSTISINGISGTAASPIYIRGESKNGTIINRSSQGRVFSIASSTQVDHVVIENMTMDAGYPPEAGANGGAGTEAIRLGFTSPLIEPEYLTFRNLVITGAPMGIKCAGGTGGNLANNILVYNCNLTGTRSWIADNIRSSSADGLRLVGSGNCVWNNTMQGYGDSIAFAHSGDESDGLLVCNYAYRNYVHNSMDNVVEFDHAQRFHAAYDNYFENVNTGVSQSDNATPSYGPTYFFRNIIVNFAKRFVKLNSSWEGWHHYNNTYIRTQGVAGDFAENSGYIQDSPSGRRNNRWAYRNNIHIARHALSASLLAFRVAPGGVECDVSHNAWYPDGSRIRWPDGGPTYTNGASEAIAATDTHDTLYPSGAGLSPNSRWHQLDQVSESNPWTNTLTLGARADTEITGKTTLRIASGSALKNAGVAIPGITDGYSGAAPDMGAVIAGRALPAWGAQ